MPAQIFFSPYTFHVERETEFERERELILRHPSYSEARKTDNIAGALSEARCDQLLHAKSTLTGKLVRVFTKDDATWKQVRIECIEGTGASGCFTIIPEHLGGHLERIEVTKDHVIMVERNPDS